VRPPRGSACEAGHAERALEERSATSAELGPRRARAPDITHDYALRDSAARVKEAATHNRCVMLTGRCAARGGHGPSLRDKRDGQLPGPAEKTAVLPNARCSLRHTARAHGAVAKARGLRLTTCKPRA